MLYRLALIFTLLFSPFLIAAQCISGNCSNGTGVYKYKDGSIYQGKFSRRKRNGKGKMSYSNGDVYRGSWLANQRHGKGELKYQKGDVYRGQWKQNVASGQGAYLFIDGEKYVGSFIQGKMNGRGEYYYSDGSVYKGSWSNNLQDGPGVLLTANGNREKLEYENGLLMSHYVQESNAVQSASNQTKEKQYADNLVKTRTSSKNCNENYCHEEQGVFLYSNGASYIGEHKNGQPNGVGVCNYPNGDVYKGEWAYHGPHGEGVFSFADGKVYAALWDRAQMVKALNKPSEHIDVLKDNNKLVGDGQVKIWSVIVGVASYNHMPSLRYTDDDAYRFYAFLKSPEGGAIPDDQIEILVDEAASKSRILQEMQTLFMKADADDVVMFYFSGHGLDGSFIPFDYDGYNNQLYHSEINQILDATAAKHKVCFADACHAGSYDVAAKAGYSSSLQDFYTSFSVSDGGTALLLSSKAEEVSLEYSGLRQGIFSHFLMRGLSGESNIDGNNIITIGELSDFVTREVRSYTAGQQSPRILGSFDRKMPVAMLR